MAVVRNDPYSDFNFMVDLGAVNGSAIDGGFSEVSGLGASLAVISYRNGNDPGNAPRQIPGLSHASEVHFRRGVIGSMTLAQWFDETATSGPSACRTITITLLDEQRRPVMSWRLLNAFPVRYTPPSLSAATSKVAIEELVVTCQSIKTL